MYGIGYITQTLHPRAQALKVKTKYQKVLAKYQKSSDYEVCGGGWFFNVR